MTRLVALLVGIGLLTAACGPAAPTAAPTTAPATAPTAGKGTVVSPPTAIHASYSNVITDNLPAWEALEGGIFKQNGLEVQLDNIPSSTGIPALLSGEVQVAQLGGSETMSAAAGGADLVILGIISPVYPFVFMAPNAVGSLDQMRGKKIGVSNAGSTSDIATRVMLRKSGLNPDTDVTVLAVGSLENRVAALVNGAIDGGLATPPDQLVLEEKGFHVIYDMAQEKVPSAGDVIAVKRSWLDQNPTVAQAYVDSVIQGTLRSRGDRAFTLTVLEKYLKTSDQHALNVTYDYFVGEVTPIYPVVGVENFADAISQLSTSNDKIKTFDVNTMLAPQFVQSALDRKVGQ
ncbi:MAG: hypothetical protein NVSMB2_16040 [Chloroflexota bacterium]